MRRIVVGFDGSPCATAALAWAKTQARLHDAPLLALAVLGHPESTPMPADDTIGADQPPGPPGGLQEAVATVAGDVPVDLQYGYGAPAAELMAACAEDDLLVVGSRGRNPVAGKRLGSVSRACLHHAPCPVVVVRPDVAAEPTYGRVIVGIDASDSARQALVVAAGQARRQGAALAAVHAVHWDRLGVEFTVPTNRQLVDWGRHLVRAELERAKVEARPVVVAGHAGDVLVHHSAHADLLVLGSRRHSPLRNLLPGTTRDHCAQHASCPVMVVPAGTGDAPADR